jgi:hypothetical protein
MPGFIFATVLTLNLQIRTFPKKGGIIVEVPIARWKRVLPISY